MNLKKFLSGLKPGYDPEASEPVICKSICTGEMTVGFVDKKTGKYHDVYKASCEADIASFCREFGIDRDKIRAIY